MMKTRAFLPMFCGLLLSVARVSAIAGQAISETSELTLASRKVEITVGAATRGPASAIADLIGVQCSPFAFSELNRNPWAEEAFREIGFNISCVALQQLTKESDPATGGINLMTREPSIGIERTPTGFKYDFSRFDARIKYLREVLHVKSIGLNWFPGTPEMYDPRSLKDGTYIGAGTGQPFQYKASSAMRYAIFDYALWKECLRGIVRHIVDDLKMPGAHYMLPGEVEISAWLGVWEHHYAICTNPTDAFGILDDYVEFYAKVYPIYKELDPKAVVCCPLTCTADKNLEGTLWSLPEFIARLRKYMDAHPEANLNLDVVHVQSYLYPKDGTLRDILDVVTKALIENRFCQDRQSCEVPIVINGWNSDFVFNDPKNPFYSTYRKSCDPIQRQAFLTGNIMREVAPDDGPRRLARSFIWPLDTDFDMRSDAAIYYPDFPEYSDPPNGALRQKAVSVAERRKNPAFASLKMLSEMKHDDVILQSVSSDDRLWALATTAQDGRMHLLMANYSPKAATVQPRFAAAAFAASRARMTLQLVDESHSSDGKGLEAGETKTVLIPESGELPPLLLSPYAVARISILPSD